MKRIVYAALATISGLVLLFSYRTSLGEEVVAQVDADGSVSSGSASTGTSTDGGGSDSGDSTASESADTGSTATEATTLAGGLVDGVYTGSAAATRYGPVQVTVTVSGGTITAVEVPEYPDSNRRDQEINNRAIPQLVSETLAAQSSDIDMVSGATYTSRGYAQSLQSAIDQATP